MRILLIYGERKEGAILQQQLVKSGFHFTMTPNGEAGIALAHRRQFDLVLLSLMLPDIPGQTALRRLKAIDMRLPVVVLSENRSARIRRRCFALGADDYLIMPFRVDELASRARAIICRKYGHASPFVTAGDLRLDVQTQRVWANGQPVPVDGPEYQLLELLVLHRGMMIAEDVLLTHAVGGLVEPQIESIQVYISEVQKKLSAIDPKLSLQIETCDGPDFRLKAPEAVASEEANLDSMRRKLRYP